MNRISSRFLLRSVGAAAALTGILTVAGIGIARGREPQGNGSAAAPAAATWSASGTLLESCTCAVPCTCNFGEGPSPHSYCHAVFAYKLDKAQWQGTDLSGLIVSGVDGPEGRLGIVDARATPEQRSALERMGLQIFAQGGPAGGPRRFVSASIQHTVNGKDLKLRLGDAGGFTARMITGRDGRSPVVVENNTTWPIPRAIKGKASELRYTAPEVGTLKATGNNANYGAFSFSGKVTETPKSVAANRSKAAKATAANCCTPH